MHPNTSTILVLLPFLFFLFSLQVASKAPTPAYTSPAVANCKQSLISFNIWRSDLSTNVAVWRDGRNRYRNFVKCMFNLPEFKKYLPKCASLSESLQSFESSIRDESGEFVGLGDPSGHMVDYLSWSKAGSDFERVCKQFMARQYHILFINAARNCSRSDSDFCVKLTSTAYPSSTPFCSRLYCYENPGSVCRLGSPELRFGKCSPPRGVDCPGVGFFSCDENKSFMVSKLNCKKRTSVKKTSSVMMKVLRKIENLRKRGLCSSLRCSKCNTNTRDDPCVYSNSQCCNCL